MTRSLRISPDLALPLDFATEGVAVIGMRGSGKSNTEARFAEVLYDAGVPFVVVDPKGDWDGIRSSADGKKPGLSVPVFGGLRGDFPLEAAAGKVVAGLLVDEMVSAVLDVSLLSKTGERPTFLIAFFRELMRRHQLDRHVRTVILEEAHSYIPQQGLSGQTAVLKEAAASVLLEGRAFGLGCWAATQRPARINKDVLEEVGTVVIHRIGAAAGNDKKTIAGWVSHHDLGTEIVDSLTRLKAGEAWVLAPQFDIIKRVQVDRRKTFDSAATPGVGAAVRRPQTMADIDAGAIKEALADTIERAKADDPKELRRRIAALEKELKQRPAEKVEVPVEVEVPVVTDEQVARLEAAMEAYVEGAQTVQGVVDGLADAMWEVRRDRQDVSRARPAGDRARAVANRERPHRAPQRPDPPERREPRRAAVQGAEAGELPGDVELTGVERKLLGVLAQLDGRAARKRFATLANYHERAKSFTNAIGHLRTLGLITGTDPIVLTGPGFSAATTLDVEPLPSGRDLVDWWKSQPKIGGVAGRILDELADAWPEPMTTEELAAALDYHPRAKSFTNALGQLRSLGLVVGRGDVWLAEEIGEQL